MTQPGTPAAQINTMDDKDRMIVTFDGDSESGAPEVRETGGIVSDRSDFTVDVDVPKTDAPASHPQGDTIVGANTEEYLEDYKTYVDRYNAEHDTMADLESAKQEAEKFEAEYGADGAYKAEPYQSAHEESRASRQVQTYSRPARSPKYVTRGALVWCMVLTMIVSSLLGAYFGSAFNKASNSGDDNRASRNDSELSQLALSDGSSDGMTVTEVVDKNADAVVEILVSGTAQGYFGQMQPVEGAGSGVIVREDGYIVTNYHVIQSANKVQVTLHNGETYPATIIGGDSDNDIAIIKINANDLKVAEIGDSSKVKVGDTAVAIGNPLGQLGGTATTGIISALDRTLTIEGRTMTLMQTDAAINGGNSGGGLFNSKGELIGIVDAKSSGVGIEGLAFAIPINSVSQIINDIIENGNVTTRPIVGVTIADVSEDSAQYYQLDEAGVYITDVTGENAKKAGFQQGDRVISIDGEKIESSQQFVSEVKKHKAGDVVSVVVSRSGQEIEIRTELEEYTEAL